MFAYFLALHVSLTLVHTHTHTHTHTRAGAQDRALLLPRPRRYFLRVVCEPINMQTGVCIHFVCVCVCVCVCVVCVCVCACVCVYGGGEKRDDKTATNLVHLMYFDAHVFTVVSSRCVVLSALSLCLPPPPPLSRFCLSAFQDTVHTMTISLSLSLSHTHTHTRHRVTRRVLQIESNTRFLHMLEASRNAFAFCK